MCIQILWGVLLLLWILMILPIVVVCFVCVISCFLIEVVGEGFCLLFDRIQLGIGGYRTSEMTPLIAARELPFFEPQRHTQPDYESFAIDIDQITPTDIEQGACVGDLPKRLVRLPVGDISQVAVLSWRWDQDSEGRSRNLATAVKYSRSAGIRYLFADVVSIDQALGSAELISKVMAFSILYSTIPVIVAYDLDKSYRHGVPLSRNHGLRMTMVRPWIFMEVRLFARNPIKLVYVGHNNQGAFVSFSAFCFSLGRPPKFRTRETCFVEELAVAWTTDFGTCIFNLLNGASGMTDVSDLKFILPAFADILTKAEGLDHADYLMTVFLFVNASKYNKKSAYAVERTFTKYHYKKYQIESYVHEENYKTSLLGDDVIIERYVETHTVVLKPAMRRVGFFKFYWEKHKEIDSTGGHHFTKYENSTDGYHFTVYENADRYICEMLGLSATEYEAYVAQKQGRIVSLKPPKVSSRQELDVVAL